MLVLSVESKSNRIRIVVSERQTLVVEVSVFFSYRSDSCHPLPGLSMKLVDRCWIQE